MFERFTNNARRVIVLAQDAAREMGHGKITPEHLILGLQRGEGLAASTMARAGIDGSALAARVAAAYESKASAKKMDKVPFAAEAKKCLEQSLTAALALGNNYIGTEHIFLGVKRHMDTAKQSLDDLLGVSAEDVARDLAGEVAGASAGSAMRSPALQAAIERARAQAGPSPMTTGDVLESMVGDPDSQASRALTDIGVDLPHLLTAIGAVNVAETSDAPPGASEVAITIGGKTTVITDPELAAALQGLSDEELTDAVRGAIELPNRRGR